MKFKIKKGDKVEVISGAEKGKTGKVLRVIPKKMAVLVEGIRTVKRHTKPMGTNPGGIIEKQIPMPIGKVKKIESGSSAKA